MKTLQRFLYKGYKLRWLLKYGKKYFDLILCFSMRAEWLSLASGAGVGHYWATNTTSRGKGAQFLLLVPKGRPHHSGTAREACIESHRKGVFSQDCSGSTVEIQAPGWHVLCLTPVILSNFNRVASQMSWLWIEPLPIYVYSRENYSVVKAKMVLSIIIFFVRSVDEIKSTQQ